MSERPCNKKRCAGACTSKLKFHANQERAPPLAQRDTRRANEADTAELTRRISPEPVNTELPSCPYPRASAAHRRVRQTSCTCCTTTALAMCSCIRKRCGVACRRERENPLCVETLGTSRTCESDNQTNNKRSDDNGLNRYVSN